MVEKEIMVGLSVSHNNPLNTTKKKLWLKINYEKEIITKKELLLYYY